MCWLVMAIIISSRSLGRVDLSDRGRALRPKAVGAAIATIPIMPALLVVSARSLRGLSLLETIRRHSSFLLRVEQKRALVSGVIFDRF